MPAIAQQPKIGAAIKIGTSLAGGSGDLHALRENKIMPHVPIIKLSKIQFI